MRIIIEIAESTQPAPTIAITGTGASEPRAEAIGAAPPAAGVRAARADAVDAGPAPVRSAPGARSVEAGASTNLGPAQEADALPAGSAPALE